MRRNIRRWVVPNDLFKIGGKRVQCYFQLLLDKYNRFILFTGTSSGRGGNDGDSFFFFPRVTKAYEVDIGAAEKGTKRCFMFLKPICPFCFFFLALKLHPFCELLYSRALGTGRER